jgi:hypothetical protein
MAGPPLLLQNSLAVVPTDERATCIRFSGACVHRFWSCCSSCIGAFGSCAHRCRSRRALAYAPLAAVLTSRGANAALASVSDAVVTNIPAPRHSWYTLFWLLRGRTVCIRHFTKLEMVMSALSIIFCTATSTQARLLRHSLRPVLASDHSSLPSGDGMHHVPTLCTMCPPYAPLCINCPPYAPCAHPHDRNLSTVCMMCQPSASSSTHPLPLHLPTLCVCPPAKFATMRTAMNIFKSAVRWIRTEHAWPCDSS